MGIGRNAPHLYSRHACLICAAISQLLEFTHPRFMPESTATVNAYLEVLFSDQPLKVVPIRELPFLIGRGQENGNHLSLDDLRISRKCAAICEGPGAFVEDRGQLTASSSTANRPGPYPGRWRPDSPRHRRRMPARLSPAAGSVAQAEAVTNCEASLAPGEAAHAEELKGLRLLLEATSLLHSQLPLESVLATMLDHAIVITHADRGMLLEPDPPASCR